MLARLALLVLRCERRGGAPTHPSTATHATRVVVRLADPSLDGGDCVLGNTRGGPGHRGADRPGPAHALEHEARERGRERRPSRPTAANAGNGAAISERNEERRQHEVDEQQRDADSRICAASERRPPVVKQQRERRQHEAGERGRELDGNHA